jgi:hypothetical protein
MLKRVTDAIFANFGLKALAVAISLGIWFYANSRLLEEVPITASISINPPQDFAVVYQSDKFVRLRVEGPRSLMDTLRDEMLQGALKMKYDLTDKDLHDGWATLQLQPSWLQLGLHEWEYAQLRSRAITPDTVRVFVSPLKDKVLPVKVTLAGEPPAGLTLQGEPATAPSQVLVRGPAIALDSMDSVPTEDVPLWKLTAGIYEEPRILRKDVQVTLDNGQRVPVALDLSVSTALVSLHVTGQTFTQQTFTGVPLNLLLPLQFRYETQVEEDARTVSVTVSADAEDLKKLSAEKIRAYLDLTALAGEQIAPGASGPYREPVVVHLPAGINAAPVQVSPPLVTVLLKNPAK